MYRDFDGIEWRIYARISKKEKVDKIWGNQIPTIVQYAERAGMLLWDEHYEDDGHTGMNDDRGAYQLMLEHIRLGQKFGIVVVGLDRLNRNLHNALHLLDLCIEYKIPILSIREPCDIFDVQGRFVYKLHSLMAEWESDVISDRTQKGLARALRDGKTLGRPPGT